MTRNTLLECRPVAGGLGVFARRAIKPGRRLLRFTGPVLDRKALEAALENAAVDSFLQISSCSYMGPSGGIDDYVNHSCEPNCGLRFLGSRIFLTAIRPFSGGEQVTFDYASTQNAYPYRFFCGCGTAGCRGDIGDFDDLPYSLQLKYHELGVLAPYLAVRLIRRMGLRRPAPARSQETVATG